MNHGEVWAPCPRCKSVSVTYTNGVGETQRNITIIGFTAMTIMCFLGTFIVPCLLVPALCGVGITALMINEKPGRSGICRSCFHRWSEEKK